MREIEIEIEKVSLFQSTFALTTFFLWRKTFCKVHADADILDSQSRIKQSATPFYSFTQFLALQPRQSFVLHMPGVSPCFKPIGAGSTQERSTHWSFASNAAYDTQATQCPWTPSCPQRMTHPA